jgi:hypothetical protein
VPVSPPRSNCWTTSHRGCSLWMSLWATLYPPAGLADRAATHEHEEWHVGVVPQKEPFFLPPIRRTGCQEVEVGINSKDKSDEDIHTAQRRHFRANPCYSRA